MLLDMRFIFSDRDSDMPSLTLYSSFIQEMSNGSLGKVAADAIAEEVWRQISMQYGETGFSPSGSFDFNVLMTIPF
jgi:hypothetical protein